MAFMGKAYGYTKLEKEDPEEKKHRQALYLIYKTLEESDQISFRRRPLRICKLKVKMGKRIKKLRKRVLLGMYRVGVYINVPQHLKTLIRLLHGGATARRLPDPLCT
ncbi:hypothetical protein Nepgr_007157 [Nepenthes gracilis]|uniref:Uncharacterized protein n=1 Tax=Nepenthes gracilis TaxID=150966 RepID=A0AAD3S6C6_NEPGR|nr:hypothetical protein Nepgr_007157 [Nepenthes gracilis]